MNKKRKEKRGLGGYNLPPCWFLDAAWINPFTQPGKKERNKYNST